MRTYTEPFPDLITAYFDIWQLENGCFQLIIGLDRTSKIIGILFFQYAQKPRQVFRGLPGLFQSNLAMGWELCGRIQLVLSPDLLRHQC